MKFWPMVIGCVQRTAGSSKLCRPAYFVRTTQLLSVQCFDKSFTKRIISQSNQARLLQLRLSVMKYIFVGIQMKITGEFHLLL